MTPPPPPQPGTPLRVGGLFEGFGGLTMAVRAVLGGKLTWYSEIDPGAVALLAHREPHVPNLGDITTIPWHLIAVDQRADVLAGGFPCQDVSLAGLMAGLAAGTRSGLWIEFARAIDELRPPLVVIENVRGLCSAPAACDLEPCPWCVGDDDGVPLRALGAVLGDLADRGYDAQWCGLRAADVGAPHGRYRIIILAWRRDLAADAAGDGHRYGGPQGVGGVPAAAVAGDQRGAVADTDCGGLGPDEQHVRAGQPDADRRAPAHADSLGHERDRHARDGRAGSAHHDQPAPDATSPGRRRAGSIAPGATEGTPAQEGGTVGRGGGAPAGSTASDADADGAGREGPEPAERRDLPARRAARTGRAAAHADGARQQQRARDVADLARRADHRAALTTAWGIYEPGIRGWEHVLGRPAPAPRTWSTSYRRALQARLDGRNRKPVGMRGSLVPQYSLNPRFVEWMQGLDEGWVCDIPDLTPNQQLRLLGNGVVPQQGAAGLLYLLAQAPPFVRQWLATRSLSAAAAA